MIRINLLSEGRRPAVARKSKAGEALAEQDISLWILIGGLVVGLLVAAGMQWSASNEKAKVDAKYKKAKKEEKRLAPILKEVNAFKKKKKRLNTKISVIEDLTDKQRGPVNVMDQVSRALPDLLWLSRMDMRGRRVAISGAAFNTNAIASFIENLHAVPEFNEPNTQNVARGRGGRYYSFRLAFRFQRVKPPEELEGGEVEAATEPDTAQAAVAGGR